MSRKPSPTRPATAEERLRTRVANNRDGCESDNATGCQCLWCDIAEVLAALRAARAREEELVEKADSDRKDTLALLEVHRQALVREKDAKLALTDYRLSRAPAMTVLWGLLIVAVIVAVLLWMVVMGGSERDRD